MGALLQLLDWMDKRVALVEERLNLVTRRIDLAAYDRFQALTPEVAFTIGGQAHFATRHWGASAEDVRFCIDFAVDAVLALGERSHTAGSTTAEQTATVVRNCDLLAYPRDEGPEVIREATSGESLSVWNGPGVFLAEHVDYVAVDQDGDVAYAPVDCLELGEETSGPGR